MFKFIVLPIYKIIFNMLFLQQHLQNTNRGITTLYLSGLETNKPPKPPIPAKQGL